MPATMESVTTMGFGISGGFTGDAELVVSQGYSLDQSPEDEPGIPGGTFSRARFTWDRVWEYRPVPNELPIKTLVGVVGEDRDYAFDFKRAPELKDGTGLTISSVEIVPDTGLDLTIGTPAVLTAAFDGIPIGKGASVRISGFEDDAVYRIACKVTLSNGRKISVPGRLVGVADVEDDGV